MTNNPVERLRNLLSPYINLIRLLTLKGVEIKAENSMLGSLIDRDVMVCADNLNDILMYLDKADQLITESGFETKSGLDYEDLRRKLDLHLAQATKEDLEAWLEMDRKRLRNATGNFKQDETNS